MRNPTVPSGSVRIRAETGIRGSETGTGRSVPRKDTFPADTIRRTGRIGAITGGEPTPDYPVGAERASVETIGGGENLLAEKAAGIQTGIITGARKREGSAAGGGKRTGFSGSNPGRDECSRRERMETATVAGFRKRTGDYQRGIDCNGLTAVSAEQPSGV